MRNLKSVVAAGVLAIVAVAAAPAAQSSLAGRWNGTIIANNVEVPFVFEITAAAGGLKTSFFNGDRRITSTASRVDPDRATFEFAQYATKLEFAIRDGQLTGEYQRARGPFPFRAVRATPPRVSPNAPVIDGTWIVAAKSNKGEAAWRFIARQKGSEVSATILRVDGDTGTLTGAYRDGRFILSHFSGARPLLLEVTPGPDQTLLLKQNGQPELVAARENAARAKAIGSPTDPNLHTRVADRSEPFTFNFPDLDGRFVSHRDPRFAGKVLLVNVSGSWCPNCHDEAPFLAALYKKYRAKGFEVVTLSFEEDDQLKNPTRLRAFIQTYGFEHTVLIPGNPDQAEEKLPQAVNLNAFPTTFLLGRDGRVRAVHAGFPSPGSGEFYKKAELEMTTQVERLLAERQPSRTKW